MADTENIPSQPSAPAPVVEASAPAAVAPVVEASAPIVETPVAPVAEVAATEKPVVEVAAKPESFLGVQEEGAEPVVDAPATDAPVVEETKVDAKVEAKPEDATAETKTETADDGALVPYETFKGIDGQEATPEFMEKFTPILQKFQTATTPQERQAIAQQIVDMGAEAVKNAAQQVNDYYKNAYEGRQREWREELLKDPVLGRNDEAFLKQSAQSMANFLAAKGGTKEEVSAFRKVVSEAGVENAPAIVRVLNNLKSRLDKYENESSRMLPGTKPAIAAPAAPGKGMINRLYGGAR
ncbi:MAG: hypothetical protein WCD70_15225 [Alphaproteobacteria bacterium]